METNWSSWKNSTRAYLNKPPSASLVLLMLGFSVLGWWNNSRLNVVPSLGILERNYLLFQSYMEPILKLPKPFVKLDFPSWQLCKSQPPRTLIFLTPPSGILAISAKECIFQRMHDTSCLISLLRRTPQSYWASWSLVSLLCLPRVPPRHVLTPFWRQSLSRDRGP